MSSPIPGYYVRYRSIFDGVKCNACGLCAGLGKVAKNISIEVHGARARKALASIVG